VVKKLLAYEKEVNEGFTTTALDRTAFFDEGSDRLLYEDRREIKVRLRFAPQIKRLRPLHRQASRCKTEISLNTRAFDGLQIRRNRSRPKKRRELPIQISIAHRTDNKEACLQENFVATFSHFELNPSGLL
jgi:hypothetical protein